jgi:autoinducer 2-degrading protein
MFVQFVHIRVKPDKISEFLDVFRVNFEGTSREPGNFRFDVLQDPEDDTHYVIYEVFDTAEAVDDHRKTAHYKATTEKLESLMTAPRTKDYFRLLMAKGRDQVA